ncbi:hypothetical protein EsH8_VIII_000201 [Colletotrichum jinshuiense]
MPYLTKTLLEGIPWATANPVAAFGVLALLLICIGMLAQLRRSSANSDIQRYQWDSGVAGTAKKRWMWDSLRLLREGYFKFYDKPWQVWTSEGYQVVLPPKYIDELKMLPDHTFPSFLREFMLPKYTFRPFPSWKLDYVNHVILHDMNKNMGIVSRTKIFPAMRNGVETALSIEFTTSTDWSEADILTQLARLTCRASGIAFVGTELEGNEEWISIGCNVLQQREQDAKIVPGYTKPNDTIQWIHDLIPEEDKKNYALQGALQLAITAVSVQSTSKLIANIILNLMKYTKYAPILLEEIETTLTECGGEWTLESMGRLEKLDSFMRESLRFEPPLTATFQRQVKKPVKLSDGTILPPGTLVFTPSDAIAFDPNFYPDPETFDGLRFYNLRQQVEETGQGGSKLPQKP